MNVWLRDQIIIYGVPTLIGTIGFFLVIGLPLLRTRCSRCKKFFALQQTSGHFFSKIYTLKCKHCEDSWTVTPKYPDQF